LPKFATAKELERFNAADALLNERRKLRLTDEQVTQLTNLRGTLFERNAGLLVRYDSVRRNFRVPKALEPNAPSGAEPPSPQEMQTLREQMLAMMEIADSLMARRPEQTATVLAVVSDDQKKDAEKELKNQSEDLRKQVPERPRQRR
jgi:CHASE3 domain sensor protein